MSLPARADENKTIIWPYFSFPPLMIVNADGTLGGINVRLQELLARSLPGYRHERINSPVNRSFLGAREGNPYCMIGLLNRPDRERFLRYSSVPCRLVPPQVVVTRKGLLDAYKNVVGQVSLRELLAEGRLVNGHIKGFSHGEVLDKIIEENSWRENLFEIVDMKSLGRQLGLLLSGRIQYFITTPDQGWYALQEQGLSDQLEVIRVSEARKWEYGYVACARSGLDAGVISRIDAALAEVLRGDELREAYRDRLPPTLWPEFDAEWERLMVPYIKGTMPSE